VARIDGPDGRRILEQLKNVPAEGVLYFLAPPDDGSFSPD
jgi:hypothetical protein